MGRPWGSTREKQFSLIFEKKVATPISALFTGLPDAFQLYVEYCRSLGFDDRPDYNYCRSLFEEAWREAGFSSDLLFDWVEEVPAPPALVRSETCSNTPGESQPELPRPTKNQDDDPRSLSRLSSRKHVAAKALSALEAGRLATVACSNVQSDHQVTEVLSKHVDSVRNSSMALPTLSPSRDNRRVQGAKVQDEEGQDAAHGLVKSRDDGEGLLAESTCGDSKTDAAGMTWRRGWINVGSSGTLDLCRVNALGAIAAGLMVLL